MDAVEYCYTIKQADLTSDNIASLSLYNELYSQIEINNSIGAKAVIFSTYLNSIELAENLEISSLELQFLQFASFNQNNSLIDIRFHDFVFKGVREVKLYSETITILKKSGDFLSGKLLTDHFPLIPDFDNSQRNSLHNTCSFQNYYLASEISSKTNDLYYCLINEESRINEIFNSVLELDYGAQFSFYNIEISEQESYYISSLNIIHSFNFVAFTSKDNIKEYFYKSLINIDPNSEDAAKILANVITRIVSNILSVTDHINAEIILRGETENLFDGSNDYSNCTYWHIDKSHGEILMNNDNVFNYPISDEMIQKTFIISLAGSRAIYTEITPDQRDHFFNLANTTMFYYGHDIKLNCYESNQITQLFDKQSISAAESGYGSVHFKGRNGSMHAAPTLFYNSRLTLLITPI